MRENYSRISPALGEACGKITLESALPGSGLGCLGRDDGDHHHHDQIKLCEGLGCLGCGLGWLPGLGCLGLGWAAWVVTMATTITSTLMTMTQSYVSKWT